MSENLSKAAAALGLPESLVQRSAQARAAASGVPVEEILAAWAGGGEAPAATSPPPAPPPAPRATGDGKGHCERRRPTRTKRGAASPAAPRIRIARWFDSGR